VPRSAIHSIKNHLTAVLRGRVVPLCSLNELLATDRPQLANDEDELATLVIRMRGEHVGILVDDFHEVADIILKPMGGILGSLSAYTGSALLGDGSVLMVLNLKELI
jgi:two-component system chemotaxis sensor kinase CheA